MNTFTIQLETSTHVISADTIEQALDILGVSNFHGTYYELVGGKWIDIYRY